MRRRCGLGLILIYLVSLTSPALTDAWKIFNNGWLNRFTGSQHRFLSVWGCKASSDKKPMKLNVMKPRNP